MLIAASLTVASLFPLTAQSRKAYNFEGGQSVASAGATGARIPAKGDVEYAFSPNGGAVALVVKTIQSARSEVRVLAYSFTSADVTAALIAAKKRGVDVKVLVDYKNNTAQDASGKAQAALNAMSVAGISVRTIAAFPIHHDKVVIVDQQSVQTGSFNYSQAAERSNSENVIVLWNNPALANGYLQHWAGNWQLGLDFKEKF